MGGLIPSWATNYLSSFVVGKATSRQNWGIMGASLTLCLNDMSRGVAVRHWLGLKIYGPRLNSSKQVFFFAFAFVLPVSVQNVAGLMVLIHRSTFYHSLYHALWLFFEKGWNGFSTSPWCSIWFLLSAVLVRSEAPLHSSQTPKWRCECTGAGLDHANSEDATCPDLSQYIQPPAERVAIPSCILLYRRIIIYDI